MYSGHLSKTGLRSPALVPPILDTGEQHEIDKDDLLYGRFRRREGKEDLKGKPDRTTTVEPVVGIIVGDVRSDEAITIEYVEEKNRYLSNLI